MSLSRAEILKPRPRRTAEVETPELGGTTRVRALRFPEFSKLWAEMKKLDEDKDAAELIALQLVAYVIDDEGNSVFQTKEEAFAFIENDSDAAVIARIISAGNQLNSVGRTAMEAAEKN